MAVKDDLKKRVPDFVKASPEWPVFLRWVAQRDVKTSSQLLSVLKNEISDCQEKLKTGLSTSKLGTANRLNVRYAKKLDFLKVCRDKIAKYL